MGPNRVRTSIKRGTPPMTHNFWAYGIVESDPHNSTALRVRVQLGSGILGYTRIKELRGAANLRVEAPILTAKRGFEPRFERNFWTGLTSS